MNNTQFKKARHALGLTIAETAHVLNVDSRTIRKWEAAETCTTSRSPNPIAVRVMTWMLDGFRPPELPDTEKHRAERLRRAELLRPIDQLMTKT